MFITAQTEKPEQNQCLPYVVLMGSHYHQQAILVQDDKLDCLRFLRNFSWFDQRGLAFYVGPMLPPSADSSLLDLWPLT